MGVHEEQVVTITCDWGVCDDTCDGDGDRRCDWEYVTWFAMDIGWTRPTEDTWVCPKCSKIMRDAKES